jgi:IS30 family transposase
MASEDKAKAREERNKAQAIEERDIWKAIEANASNVIQANKRKPKIHYSEELVLDICEQLSNGVSLQRICQKDGYPTQSTIFIWLEDKPFFRDIYTRARENAAHTLFDQMLDIADDSSADLLEDGSANNAAIQRARLRIDTRARVAGKLAPRVYGERVEQLSQTVNVTNNSLTIDGASLGADQRTALRQMLLQARDGKVIDN